MNLLSYDIELYDEFPTEGEVDFSKIRPSIACIGTEMDGRDFKYYYEQMYMGKRTCRKLVKDILSYFQKGFVPFTWNGLNFDFKLLATHSEMYEECGTLALNHIDPMFEVFCRRGHMLGLDKVLVGCGLESKLHSVILNDNTTFAEMNGSHAPRLWRTGQYWAVRDYLEMDVIQPLKLAEHIQKTGEIQWTSNSGKRNRLKLELLTVKESLQLPVPDSSWMTNPAKREDFYSWIPRRILAYEVGA
jgi:hypothetical protein